MVTVQRFELEEVPGSTQIQVPKNAKILSAQHHPAKGCISLWALVDEDQKETEVRMFIAASTGGFYLENIERENLRFIGTCQESMGTIVWHVFERMGWLG